MAKIQIRHPENTFEIALRWAAESYVEKEISGYNLTEVQVNEIKAECESWLRTWFSNYEIKIPEV